MYKKDSGFTLVELVIVIIILGILAAAAIPQFIDISSDARTSAVQGIAGALSSANAINYAARKASSSKGITVTNCTNLSAALAGGLPSGYTITSAAVTADATINCTLTATTGGATATFTATGVN